MNRKLKLLILYVICTGIFVIPILIFAPKPLNSTKLIEFTTTLSFMGLPAYGLAVLFSKKGQPTSLKLTGVLWILFNFSIVSSMLT